MGRKRLLFLSIVVGPALLLVVGSVLALAFLPHPIPKNATRVQKLYLGYCAECHGADGGGSWRATLFMLRPGDLAAPSTLAARADEYVFDLIKHGGAPIGKPGMPAFGYHLTDEEIRELVRYVRGLSAPKG